MNKAHPLHGGQGQRPQAAAQVQANAITETRLREEQESQERHAKFEKRHGPNWKASKRMETTGHEHCVHPVSRRRGF